MIQKSVIGSVGVRASLAALVLTSCVVSPGPGGGRTYGPGGGGQPVQAQNGGGGDPNGGGGPPMQNGGGGDPNGQPMQNGGGQPVQPMSNGGGGHGGMPNLVGMSLEQAQATARAAGLHGEVEDANFECDNPNAVKGMVDCQRPPAGDALSANQGIEVHIYRPRKEHVTREVEPPPGPGVIKMRELIGMSKSEAEAKLTSIGIPLGNIMIAGLNYHIAHAAQFDFSVAKVVDTEPEPDRRISAHQQAGNPVALYYAPRLDQQTPVSLIGMKLRQGRVLALQVGFTGSIVERESNPPLPDCSSGWICATEPASWQGTHAEQLVLIYNK